MSQLWSVCVYVFASGKTSSLLQGHTGVCWYWHVLFVFDIQSCLLSSHVNGFFSSLLSSVLNGCSLPIYYYPPIKSNFNKQTTITCFTEKNGIKTTQMRLYPETLS